MEELRMASSAQDGLALIERELLDRTHTEAQLRERLARSEVERLAAVGRVGEATVGQLESVHGRPHGIGREEDRLQALLKSVLIATPEHARAMDKARKRERRLQAELARCALDLERERERGVAQVRGLEGKLEVVEGKVQQLEAQLRERCCEAGKRETTGGSDKSGACCQAMKLLPGMVKRLKECSEDHEDTCLLYTSPSPRDS
eukprot:TRINITY_DN28853_c0_g1_i2.p1 TRINITY_DN28853_c0_g1~~TRINITY_DN28853_c0_g1_i2.p1  ORF type:complete len:204 (+),score=47.76 TRINITY_DN28853_c0_g1_i2:3-614(+)